ncbi:MFS transporter [Sphingomonas sp. 36D10-4-7]|uniref:MFS transporter n=1 Tax=Sphingomonas corticis TaxID=2722791 RepID=A0ABX1CQB1_9SPHN|nr:MFS transporter [Sphingomonas corticis]
MRTPLLLASYALAYSGAVIGYLPLLSLLLPLKVERIAGAARLDVLTACMVAGAVVASASNILFGWLSDRAVARGRGRRGWLAAGGAMTAASYATLALAQEPVAIVVAVVLFQAAINALLAPLLAMMAEEVPDDRKGVAGGLLALAAPVAAAVSAGLVAAGGAGEAAQLAVVAALALLCQLPLLTLRARPLAAAPPAGAVPLLRRDLAIAWAARLLVQAAGNAQSFYLLYYFSSIVAGASSAALAPRVGSLLTLAFAAALPVAMLLGRWSDRSGRRKPFLFAAALGGAAGLALMARAGDWNAGAAGFALYAVGSATFLALHAGFAMQLLPNPAHRGRDLGLLNLANTLPALAGPLLTWWLATPDDFGAVMAALSALTLIGGVLMLLVRGRA